MSDICFKNLAANYNSQHYYADSISFSESAPMQEIKTLGNAETTSIMANPVEGTISMSFYFTTGAESSAMTGQLGKTGFKGFNAGPLSVDKALLTSWSVEGSASEVIKGSAGYAYYGSLTSGAAVPSTAPATINPAHGAKTTLSIGDLGVYEIQSFTYSIDQSYEATYALGSLTPTRISMTEGTITLDIEGPTDGTDWEKTVITGVDGLCPPAEGVPGANYKDYTLSVRSLCDDTPIMTISNSGILDSKSFSITPGEPVSSSFTLINKFPNAEIEVEC
jgi:hypothetical protein